MRTHIHLEEANKRDLILKSKSADNYSIENQGKGRNRFERRRYSRINASVKEMNNIDCNSWFKYDLLSIVLHVSGETNDYYVRVTFEGSMENLAKQLNGDDTKDIDVRLLSRALTRAFNSNDVWVSCTCPDWKYRMAYYSTRNSTNSGEPEIRPSDITNPNDSKGSGCKHVLLVLNNTSWMLKAASTLRNYILYMKNHQESLYYQIMYPKLYGHEFTGEYQTSIDDMSNVLDTEPDSLDTSNKWARERTQFKKGNEYRFKKQDTDDIEGQQEFKFDNEPQFDLDSLEDEE